MGGGSTWRGCHHKQGLCQQYQFPESPQMVKQGAEGREHIHLKVSPTLASEQSCSTHQNPDKCDRSASNVPDNGQPP